MSEVLFEKVNYQSFQGFQTSQIFPVPVADPLVLSAFHGAFLLMVGSDLNDVGIPTFQLDMQAIPETRRVLPYKRNTASTFTRLLTRDGQPHPYCTRTLLERTERELANQGIEFLIGTELEMHVYSVKDRQPIHTDFFAAPCVTTPEHPACLLLEEAILALQEMDIPILKYHTEGYPGQLELALKPMPPGAAADAVLRVKEVFRAIALRNGYRASFAPVTSYAGHDFNVGIHHHISLKSQAHKPLPPDVGFILSGSLTAQERSFAAGVFAHFGALMAISMPHPASYARLKQVTRYVYWGSEVHAGALRLAYNLDKERRPIYHWEYRAADGTSDPHFVLASILQAGGKGILDQLPLDQADIADPTGKHLEMMLLNASLREARAKGAAARVPSSLEEALDELDFDDELKSLLGEELVRIHIGARKISAKQFNSKSAGEKDAWLMAMY